MGIMNKSKSAKIVFTKKDLSFQGDIELVAIYQDYLYIKWGKNNDDIIPHTLLGRHEAMLDKGEVVHTISIANSLPIRFRFKEWKDLDVFRDKIFKILQLRQTVPNEYAYNPDYAPFKKTFLLWYADVYERQYMWTAADSKYFIDLVNVIGKEIKSRNVVGVDKRTTYLKEYLNGAFKVSLTNKHKALCESFTIKNLTTQYNVICDMINDLGDGESS